MDSVNMDAFYASLDMCMVCVGFGLTVGFILRFLVFGLLSVWNLFRHISRTE